MITNNTVTREAGVSHKAVIAVNICTRNGVGNFIISGLKCFFFSFWTLRPKPGHGKGLSAFSFTNRAIYS